MIIISDKNIVLYYFPMHIFILSPVSSTLLPLVDFRVILLPLALTLTKALNVHNYFENIGRECAG